MGQQRPDAELVQDRIPTKSSWSGHRGELSHAGVKVERPFRLNLVGTFLLQTQRLR